MALENKKYTLLFPRDAPIYYKEEDVKKAVLEYKEMLNTNPYDRFLYSELERIFGKFDN